MKQVDDEYLSKGKKNQLKGRENKTEGVNGTVCGVIKLLFFFLVKYAATAYPQIPAKCSWPCHSHSWLYEELSQCLPAGIRS